MVKQIELIISLNYLPKVTSAGTSSHWAAPKKEDSLILGIQTDWTDKKPKNYHSLLAEWGLIKGIALLNFLFRISNLIL